MAGWTIEGDGQRYEGTAVSDGTEDISHGFRFTLARGDDERRLVDVEAVRGGTADAQLAEPSARAEVYKHLTDPEPPRRIVMHRDGTFEVTD